MNKKLKVLELFSGTQSISKQFRESGHNTFTIDNNDIFEPPLFDVTDCHEDIFKITPEYIIEKFGRPDVIWASVPCQAFSVASIGKHWDKETKQPKTEFAALSQKLVQHTLWLIKELNPTVYFIENPRGMLRKMPFMEGLDRHTISYCQYRDTRMKPTDIWSNHPNPNFKPPCKNGDPCHVAAPRGSATGTQGLGNAIERARIPKDFCNYIVIISEEVCNETNM